MNKDSRIVKALTCIGECCLSCLERFLNFINKNAYIQTALEGTSFCRAAMNAFSLLLRNCLRVGALAIVSTVFLQVPRRRRGALVPSRR
jgi:choline transporter-like protein 2/4/5